MDAVEFIIAEEKMCNHFGRICAACPASSANNGQDVSCTTFKSVYPKEYVAIVEKFIQEYQEVVKYD